MRIQLRSFIYPGVVRAVLALSLLSLISGFAASATAADSYVLAVNDLLDIRVFQEDDLTSAPRVSQKGTINLPLVGEISVAGMSPQEAANAIRVVLAKDYLVNPQVTLTVTEYGKRRFTVLGEVQKAGSYDMPEREKVTLLDAIAMAGGYTRLADPGKVVLRRQSGDKEVVLRLNAKAMAKDNRISSFRVEPGDIITVGESLF